MGESRVVRSVLACGLGAWTLAACVDLDALDARHDVGTDANVEGGVTDSDAAPADGSPPDSAGLDQAVDQTTGNDSATDSSSAPDAEGGTTVGPPWWSLQYTSREQLTVTNGSAQALPTGFQLGWPVDVETLIGPGSFGQLRLVRWDGSMWTELPRVIDDPGVHQEWLWARLVAPIGAGGTDSSYYLPFGNASPPRAPNDPGTVFDL